MAELLITSQAIPDGFRVALNGEADMSQFEKFDAEMMLLGSGTAMLVELDISNLTFISSAGMGAILKLRSVLGKRGGVLKVGGARPEIAEAFSRARLDRVIAFVPAF